MANTQSRADFYRENPKARAVAALAHATNQQLTITPGAIKIKPGQFKDKKVLIIGSGVGGLTTAYELLEQQSGAEVTIVEALNRTGGRCLSLRTGDTLIEDENSDLFDAKPGTPQTVRFKRPLGDNEPYLNAGPGRIPSSHKRLLGYLQKFAVDVEIYVMNSGSNLVQMEGETFGGDPLVYRRLDHNTRGWLAQMVHSDAKNLIKKNALCADDNTIEQRTKQLQDLMIDFGELDKEGKYQTDAGDEGFENGVTRAGYTVLPGVSAGETAKAISFDNILASEFWKRTRFYQPQDFLWQPTLFQPVGGMDRVQHAFAQQVAALGGNIHLNTPVENINWCADTEQFVVTAIQIGTDELKEYRADYVFCNAAMPFLKNILDESLQPSAEKDGLEDDFKTALQAVFRAQFEPTTVPNYKPPEKPVPEGYVAKFLACTTKVGWQADRVLWQGNRPVSKIDKLTKQEISDIEDSEIGVVPIFGGISWTEHDITQIWYPSNDYHDEKGTLTGTYNFSGIAYTWGKMTVQQRLDKAREGAALFSKPFAAGLHDGLAIAWQNMPHIKGGWAQWQAVGDADFATDQFNVVAQGSGVWKKDGCLSDPCFFIVGDQISSLPGWQEGAIAAALNALTRMANPKYKIPYLSCLPDPRLMVEGI